MATRKVIWSLESSLDMIDIMNYYNSRNKSKTYSSKLYKEIQKKSKKLDFKIAYPKKTSDKKLFYLTHKHIFVGFDIDENTLIILLIIDERRSPELMGKIIDTIR